MKAEQYEAERLALTVPLEHVAGRNEVYEAWRFVRTEGQRDSFFPRSRTLFASLAFNW